MGKEPRLRSQQQVRRRGRPRVLGRQSKSGGTRNRVWSARPDPGEHQHSGVLRCSLAFPRKQRATAAPTEDEARGPTQASSYAGPPRRHGRDQTTGIKHIPSRPIPCLTYRPNTSARHANLTARLNLHTSEAHLRHHVRGSGHGTQLQCPWVPGRLHPSRRRGQPHSLIADQDDINLVAEGEATTRGVPPGPRATHPCALGRSVCDPVLCATHTGG